MAPRAYWKGYLKLSLVSCPISLFPATSERDKISFHQLNTGHPIKEKVEALDKLSRTEYLASHKVDALLQPAVVRRAAQFSFDEAKWDGSLTRAAGDRGRTPRFGVRAEWRHPCLRRPE